jgi:hypothetical protein
MQLTEHQFKEYDANPVLGERMVRQVCGVPDGSYFTVSVWPVSGEVRLHGHREKPLRKISKSDRP